MSQSIAQKKTAFPSNELESQPATKGPRVFVYLQQLQRNRTCRRFTPEEIRLDQDMQALFDEIRDEEGQYPTPDFQRVARGDGFPWRILARYIVRAAKKGGDEERVLALIERLGEFTREVFRRYSRRLAA